MNEKEISTSIPDLQHRLAPDINEMYIAIEDCNHHHEAFGVLDVSRALIEKLNQMWISTQRWGIE